MACNVMYVPKIGVIGWVPEANVTRTVTSIVKVSLSTIFLTLTYSVTTREITLVVISERLLRLLNVHLMAFADSLHTEYNSSLHT
jgi:hypothetical protein